MPTFFVTEDRTDTVSVRRVLNNTVVSCTDDVFVSQRVALACERPSGVGWQHYRNH